MEQLLSRKSRSYVSGRGTTHFISHALSFDESLEALRIALGEEPQFPQEHLRRAQLKSDALREIDVGDQPAMLRADMLLTEAIEIELKQPFAGAPSRHHELCLLRGRVRSARHLARFDDAICDFDAVLTDEPLHTQALLEKAKVLRFKRCWHESLVCYRRTIELGEKDEAKVKGYGLTRHVKNWICRNIAQLEERLIELAAAESGEFGFGDAGNENLADSGDGSGRWKVVKIVGVSWDSCIYHLENHPPASPHPLPHAAWHVDVRFGSAVREYTPVSSAQDWEKGRLDLLVKTYADGQVSCRFATLQPANDWASLEDQTCWVLVSVPKLTLALPALTDTSSSPIAPVSTVCDIGIVVGGTGVAPALQLLREVSNTDSAFGPSCRAKLLYSSRAPADVLLLDELRDVEAKSAGRISVKHTLTNIAADDDLESKTRLGEVLPHIPGRHYYFTSKWKPFKPKDGALDITEGSEGGLRGRISPEMLRWLPLPGQGTRIVVCGPPKMWDDVKVMLLAIGHSEECLVELKALSAQQMA